ncbi:hypothetical protein [Kaistia hirudinis]|uniref:hypothetical protein n=1 Tax=Kaistia hirudinis TaxID=1293440 RepID=UPI001AEE6117|nr:hypothetical protein [Kaistia hirudinis]
MTAKGDPPGSRSRCAAIVDPSGIDGEASDRDETRGWRQAMPAMERAMSDRDGGDRRPAIASVFNDDCGIDHFIGRRHNRAGERRPATLTGRRQ